MSVTTQLKGGLVSVVVACHRSLQRTMRCVEALLRHTRRPWELVTIAEGDCAAYLAGIRDAVPIHVEVVSRNGDMTGFRHGPGLKVACGDYIALLDDGTIVFEDWLDQLVGLADSGAKTGMVGPMLNDAASPQWAEMADALDLQTLGRFAEDWRDRHRRQWLTTSRLADGCVLLRRPLFEEVNGPSIRSMADLGQRSVLGGSSWLWPETCSSITRSPRPKSSLLV